MADAAKDNPNAQLLVRTLKFATGASWVTTAPVPIEDFAWDDLDAGGVTDLGKAFEMLAAQLTIPPMTDRALPPVLVLLSDGQPTDDYKKHLDKLLHLPWGKKAVRIAISIGQDADDDVLEQFSRENAWEKANTIVRRLDIEQTKPSMFSLSTDGFANSYKDENEFKATVCDYLKMINEHGAKAVEDNLASWLTETSSMGCGDDITMLIAYFSPNDAQVVEQTESMEGEEAIDE